MAQDQERFSNSWSEVRESLTGEDSFGPDYLGKILTAGFTCELYSCSLPRLSFYCSILDDVHVVSVGSSLRDRHAGSRSVHGNNIYFSGISQVVQGDFLPLPSDTKCRIWLCNGAHQELLK